jgi:hypothetical protein
VPTATNVCLYAQGTFGARPPARPLPLIAAEPLDACTPLTNSVLAAQHTATTAASAVSKKHAVLVTRGGCNFATKALNLQAVGSTVGAMIMGAGESLLRTIQIVLKC